MKTCPNCRFQNNPENQVCSNCGLKFREFVTPPESPPPSAPLSPLPEGSQDPKDHQKKFEELGAELEKSQKKNLELQEELEKFQKSFAAKTNEDSSGKEPQGSSSTWDEFLEKLPLGKTRLGKILKPILVGSTKPVGPTLQKILGQRWGGWSVIATLVASLSGVVYGTMPGEEGQDQPERLGSAHVGVLMWEGPVQAGEKIMVEKGQLMDEPMEAGKASVSGAWPVEPSCGLWPVTAGAHQVMMDQQPTTENAESFAFQVKGLKPNQVGLKNIYFLWDCPKNKGTQE